MAHVPILRGFINKDGVPVFDGLHGKRFATIKQFLRGERFELTLQKERKKTTTPQRKYYFAVICATFGDLMGCTPEQAHEALKREFLTVDPEARFPVTRSTESLTTKEREEYHDRCRQLAAEFFGHYIELPNETEISEPMGVCA